MTTEKNNSIININSKELVQYKNKFKSIAIYNEEIYESEVVELINEANAGFGTLVLKAEATEDKKELVLSLDWINGNAPTDVVYTWKALAPDGYTDLIKNENANISLDNEQNKLTIIDQTQLTSAITVTVIAYKQNIFVAQSAPYTVFEKGQQGKDGVSFTGIIEKYYATADKDEDPTWDSVTWNDTVSESGYSEVNRYLWNYEIVTTDSIIASEKEKKTNPALISVWGATGRAPKQFISYYAVKSSPTDYEGAPILVENGNRINDTGTTWKMNPTDLTLSAGSYLLEKIFIEYDQKDNNKSNLYQEKPIVVIGSLGENGETPYIENGKWYINMDGVKTELGQATGNPGDTPFINDQGNWQIGIHDTETKAAGTDGVSFVKIEEEYYTTIASSLTDADKAASWSLQVPSIYGTLDSTTGQMYKYLWNREKVYSKDATGTLTSETSDPSLHAIYDGDRVVAGFINYYAASSTIEAPGNVPDLTNDNNSITLPTGSTWKLAEDFTGSADANDYLFECSFVKYAAKDKDGKNLYGYIGTTIAGHNGRDGRAIGTVIEYYARSRTETKTPTTSEEKDDNGNVLSEAWDTTLTAPNKDLPYLWNYEVSRYDDINNTQAAATDPVIIAYYTEDGANGRSIKSIQNYYLINAGTKPDPGPTTDAPNSGSAPDTWYKTAPQTTETYRFLWNSEIVTYLEPDGETETDSDPTEPANIGTHGVKGNDGSGIAIFRSTYQSVTTTQLNNLSQAASDTWEMHQTPVDNQGNVLKVGDPFYAQVHCISDNKDYAILLHVRTAYSAGEKSIATKNAQGYFQIGDTGPQGAGILTEIEVYQLSEDTTPPSIEVTEDNIKNWIEKNNLGNFPNDGKDYLWRCLKQTWNDGNTTFTTPILLSDYEMGTLFAQIEGINIARWCENYGRTLINGSTIATGTITAKQINTEGLSAEYIKSSNYIDFFEPPIPPSIQGLRFIDKDTYYEVAWDGTAQEIIVIPETYRGKPVSTIAADGFYDCSAKTIYIPTSIKTIYEERCFSGGALRTLYLPNIFYINDGFADGTEALTTVIFLTGTELRTDYLTGGNVHKTLEVLGLPGTLKTVTAKVFSAMEALTTINFAGSEEEWNTIENIADAEIPAGVTIKYLKQGFKISSAENENMIDSLGFKVTQDGQITANKGGIAGWNISEDRIDKKDANGNSLVGISSSTDDSYTSLVNEDSTSPVRFYAGQLIKTVKVEETITASNLTFTYSPSDCKKILKAEFRVSTGGSCAFSGIGTDTLTATYNGADNGILTITYEYEPLNFIVLEDGSLYAQAADITGTIRADGGQIGAFKLEPDGSLLSPYMQITEKNIFLNSESGVKIGNNAVTIGVGQYNNENTALITTEETLPFIIKGASGGGIKIDSQKGEATNNSVDCQVSIYHRYKPNTAGTAKYNGFDFPFEITHSTAIPTQSVPVTATFWIQFATGVYSNFIVDMSIPSHCKSGYCTINRISTLEDNTIGVWETDYDDHQGVFVDSTRIRWSSAEFVLNINGTEKRNYGGDVGDLTDNTRVMYAIGYGTENLTNNVLYSLGHFFPDTDNNDSLSCGDANHPWDSVWTTSGSVNKSDKRAKNSIQTITESYEIFYDNLEPVLYKYNNGASDRLHSGFIAQQVEESLNLANISTKDFAGICIDNSDDALYFLRYSEFIPLNTWQIQKLKARAKQAEETIELQDTYIKKLEERIEKLEQMVL